MIKRLKRNFILTFMFFITILLLVIQGSFYIANRYDTYVTHERILNQALGLGNPLDETILNNYNVLTAEINDPLNLITISANQWDQSDEDIIEMIEYAIENDDNSGILSQYNVQFSTNETPFTKTYAFIDLTLSKQSLRSVMFWMIIVSALIWSVSFLVAYYFARKVVQPVKHSMEQQQQLVSNLSHELKNPLAIISSNVEILASNSTNEQEKWIGYIQDETHRMKDLVSSMLYLSQSDENLQQVPLSPINLSDISLQVLLPLEALAFEQQKTFHIDVQENLYILGHEALIKQLISILTDNAFKYSNDKGTITVSIKRHQHQIICEVSNTGDTIDPKDAVHIFERFYRKDPSRSSQVRGYGLGLSIAKVITQQLHGQIEFKSKDNINQFIVSFPSIKKETTLTS